jgi:hypothetical protein
MPVFRHPARVVVDEGGSDLAAAVLAIAAVAVIASVIAVIIHTLVLILATLAVLTVAGTAYLVRVLRRDGLRMWRPPSVGPAPAPVRVVASRPAQAIPAPRPDSIEAPRPQLLPGHAVQPLPIPRETP